MVRDIRADLSERLEALEWRRNALKDQLTELDREAETVQLMLAYENKRASEGRIPMGEFIEAALAEEPLTKEDVRLKCENAGYFPAIMGGRQVHATMLNLENAGRIRKRNDGKYEPARGGNPGRPVKLGGVAQ